MPEWTERQTRNFWRRVDVRSPDECWPWMGSKNSQGYGMFSWQDVPGHTKGGGAHRFIYERLIGPIPEGLVLDHLCHDHTVCKLGRDCPHRACCNPSHMRPCTNQENTLRGGLGEKNKERWRNADHCKRGHVFAGWNLIITARGTRECRACQYMAIKRYQGKNKEKRAAAARLRGKRKLSNAVLQE